MIWFSDLLLNNESYKSLNLLDSAFRLLLTTAIKQRKVPLMIFRLLLASGPDIAPSDVRKDDMSIRMLRLYIRRSALPASTWSIVPGIEPGHLLCRVVPDTHC